MIELKNLSKTYISETHKKKVLDNISLEIPKGKNIGLIGKNGAGKSTLLRLIAGMDYPDEGEIINTAKTSWPIGLSGGFQGSLTGIQNLKFVSRIYGKEKEIPQIIEYVKDFSELGEALNQPVKTYSSGMKSRLAFGMSLAFNFELYLSDEATAVGDKTFKAKAYKAFQERMETSDLIIVSHSEGIIKDLCQATILVNDTKAIWFDSVEEGLNEYNKIISIK